jgi:hypothetical protein
VEVLSRDLPERTDENHEKPSSGRDSNRGSPKYKSRALAQERLVRSLILTSQDILEDRSSIPLCLDRLLRLRGSYVYGHGGAFLGDKTAGA